VKEEILEGKKKEVKISIRVAKKERNSVHHSFDPPSVRVVDLLFQLAKIQVIKVFEVLFVS
jgi:hypothetical protein